MKKRLRVEVVPRMLNEPEAAIYSGLGITKARVVLKEIGAKRRFGKRVIYDKVVIDKWLDSLGAEVEEGEVV